MDSNNLPEKMRRWIVQEVGGNANILSTRRLKGSTSSTLHHVNLRKDGKTLDLVIRHHHNEEWFTKEPDLVRHEVHSLLTAQKVNTHTPVIVAYDENGENCGSPAILMTMVEGNVELLPRDMEQWLASLAKTLVKIHQISASDFSWKYFPYNNPYTVTVPTWSLVPEAWEKAISMAKQSRPMTSYGFIHRDYHPTNVLWKGGEIHSVVDWVTACYGPKGVDVGHCRLNLALLFGVEIADEFLHYYCQYAGKSFNYERYWDVVSVIDTLFGPPEVYPGWVAFGVEGLTNELIAERMDSYLIHLISSS